MSDEKKKRIRQLMSDMEEALQEDDEDKLQAAYWELEFLAAPRYGAGGC